MRKCDDGAGTSYQLLRKPLHVPSSETLHIFHYYFKAIEIQRGNGVEGDIKEYEGPFEEGVDRVG